MITVRRRNESESEITWLEEQKQKEKEVERNDILHDWSFNKETKKIWKKKIKKGRKDILYD